MNQYVLSFAFSACFFFLFSNSLHAQLTITGPQNNICVGQPYIFSVNTSNAEWSFGNGQSGQGSEVTITYSILGDYTIEVVDFFSGETASLDITVTNTCLIGPTEVCEDECVDYQLEGIDQSVVTGWMIVSSGGNVLADVSTSDEIFTYCWDVPAGEYIVGVQGQDGAGAPFSFHLDVTIGVGGVPATIGSLTSAFCVVDSLNPDVCEKVCANTSAIYQVPGAQNVAWEVLGADSFIVSGNSVEVNWGAPGNGLLTATTTGGTQGGFIVNCGYMVDNNSPVSLVQLYAFPNGGAPPYQYEWYDPSGSFMTTQSNVILANVQSGDSYTVYITDANGNSATCSTTISSTCVSILDIGILHPLDCNDCSGEISIQTNVTQNFTFEWSTGDATSSIENLCIGNYEVTITNQQGCTFVEDFVITCPSMPTCESETTLCVEILEDPESEFSTIPPSANGVVSICQGQTVVFQNQSIGASIFQWEFGNGNVSSDLHTEQIYLTPGTYDAFLIARNDCYCNDTTAIQIEVADAISPLIDCVGTICESTVVTYSTMADCGIFNWSVAGDFTIVDGGGASDNFITIDWLTGPEGTIELSVENCSGGNYCMTPTVETIPILSDDATIQGPEKVCQKEEAIYFLNDFSGTDFVWEVSSGGVILEGQNTNRIKVKWDAPISPNADQWVSVQYDNCYLGCGGNDLLEIFILPEFYVEGAIDFCKNDNSTHTALKNIAGPNQVDCDWVVTAFDGSVVWSAATPVSSINLDWSAISIGGGRYSIRAIPADPLEVCQEDFLVFVNILPAPPPVSSVGGASQICPGESYTYQANSTQPANQFSWTINDGGNISTQNGSTINVAWGNTPPYQLSVTQTSTQGVACESEPLNFEVFPLPNFSINGDGNICKEIVGNYMVAPLEGVSYDWNIIPAEAGTIITGQATEAIEIFWHETGTANVQLTICGNTQSMPVNVVNAPQPIIDAPANLCSGETGIVSTTTSFDMYVWKNSDGTVLSNDPTVELTPGTYQLEVTDNFGCQNNITFTIDAAGDPSTNISVFGNNYACFANGSPPVEIHASQNGSGFSFQWFLDNNPIPTATNSILSTTSYGTYHVVVTSPQGCSVTSNVVNIIEWCSGGGGGNGSGPGLPNCPQGTDVTFTFSSSGQCDVFNFNNTSPNYVPGTLQWDFGDPASGNNFSSLENPIHTFSSVGFYTVELIAQTNGGGLCWDAALVTVPLVADFDFEAACENQPTPFFDLSEILPNNNISNWSWDFGDPASGSANFSNNQNPTHIFANAGTYDVTLAVTHSSGCTSSVTQTVTVATPPSVTFDIPNDNCENVALPFAAQASPDAVFIQWNFGDPASGVANFSEITNPWHAFSAPGNYNVICTVTDVFGCSMNQLQTIIVESNTLSGAIDFSQPSPICEGDSTTLTAPSGGVAWQWSDGSTTENITTGAAGIYSVTMTDADGCEYIAPAVTLDVTPLPTTVIQAVEFNEFGQPIGSFFDGYAACEGEDVFLQVLENPGYSYMWSDSTTGTELVFSEDRDNELAVGTHNIFINVTDDSTGCNNIVGPFTIEIHPTPTDIFISAMPQPPICENTLTTLTVENPQSDLTYIWNTGELGTSIEVLAGGEYFARGITPFGCSGESNKIEITPGPDIRKIPDGCHTRCNPDTICLPPMEGVASFQWYLDGSPIPAPDGTVGDLIANQSGEYFVMMTDTNGCTNTSEIVTLDLLDGFGTFSGNVYFDVNENGIIDASDTLMSGIDIILSQGGMGLDTLSSDGNGAYAFPNIFSSNYTLTLDTTQLPLGFVAVWSEVDSSLVGCDDLEIVNWLLQEICLPTTATLNEQICFGENYFFNGTPVPPNVPTEFILTNSQGCDSIVTLVVVEFPALTGAESFSICSGEMLDFNGTMLPPGTTTDFTLMATNGCDSIVSISVLELPIFSNNESITVCNGESAEYNGEILPPGSTTDFTFMTMDGCDSIITVSVFENTLLQENENFSVCLGGTVDYNGTMLPAGSTTDFVLIGNDGCDSIVTVTVDELPEILTNEILIVCNGEMATYNGTQLAPGSSTDFTFLAAGGCDSIVSVFVEEMSALSGSENLSVCQGGMIEYNGTMLSAGTTTDFILTSANGCDSMVAVTVAALPPILSNETLTVCNGEMATYNGTQLAPGSSTDFNLVTADGCDSIVTIFVEEMPALSGSENLSVCQGGMIEYNGTMLSAGTTTDFILTSASGCDSIVMVVVAGLPPILSSATLAACNGGTAIYNGTTLDIGSVTDFTFSTADGCDSIVTITVTELPLNSNALTLTTCFGELVEYNGVHLAGNTVTEFMLVAADGCDSVVTVSVTELPLITSQLELSACNGDAVIYNGTSLAAGSSTDFVLESSGGCDSIVTVDVVPLPTSVVALEMEVCPGEVFELNGQNLPIGSQTEFIFENQFGCDSIVIIHVVAFPEVEFSLASEPACPGNSDGVILVENLFGTPPFSFSIDGNNFQNESIFENLFSNEYAITVQDNNGCTEEESIGVPMIPPLEFEIVAPQLPCDGGSIILQPEFISGDISTVNYLWSDGSNLPQLAVNQPDTYSVTITDQCTSEEASVSVSFEPQGKRNYFYIPNAFSPNDDGINDIFKVEPAGDVVVESFDLFIFDRWGNHLLDVHDIEEGWDGRMNTEKMNPGVYVWYVRAHIVFCGRNFEIFKKGDVTIVR